jgi:hypothetical protein
VHQESGYERPASIVIAAEANVPNTYYAGGPLEEKESY